MSPTNGKIAVAGHERADRRQRAHELDAARVEPDLLVGLTQRGQAQILVGLVLAPAGERDLTRVPAQVGAALGEHRGEPDRVERSGTSTAASVEPWASRRAASSSVRSSSRSDGAETTSLLSARMSDHALWERMHSSMWLAFRAVPAASSGRVLELDGVLAGITPAVPERSLPNSVLYDSEEALAAALPTLAERYDEAGIDAWTVWVPEHHERARRLLADAGHELDGMPTAMIADLAEVDAAAPRRPGARRRALARRPRADQRPGLRHRRLPSSASSATVRRPALQLHSAAAGPRRRVGAEPGPPRRLQHLVGGDRARGPGSGAGSRAHAARPRGRPRARMPGLDPLQASKLGRPVYERLGYRGFGAIEMWERRRA